MSELKINKHYENKTKNITQKDLLRLNQMRNAIFEKDSALKSKKRFKQYAFSFTLTFSIFISFQLSDQNEVNNNFAFNNSIETNEVAYSVNSSYLVTDSEFTEMFETDNDFKLIDVLF